MKKFACSLILASFLILMLGLSAQKVLAEQQKAEKQVILRVQSAVGLTLPTLGTCLTWFAQQVEVVSGGSILVKTFDPGKLVPALEIHDAVSTGKVNAGYTVAGYIAGKVPTAELFVATPFGLGPLGLLAWLWEGNGLTLFQETFDKAGYNFKIFPLLVYGPETGGWFAKPIEKLEDMKGLRLRWYGLGGRVLQKLGCSISLIPGSEIYPSLEKGAIDGTEFGQPAVDEKVGFYKVAKYNHFPGWHQPASQIELIINKNTWNGMSKRQQAIIELAVRATNSYTLANSEAMQGKIIRENVEKRGVHNIYWSNEVLDALKKAWQEVAEELSAKDEQFKKVWTDQKAFMVNHEYWESYGYLPRPPRHK